MINITGADFDLLLDALDYAIEDIGYAADYESDAETKQQMEERAEEWAELLKRLQKGKVC